GVSVSAEQLDTGTADTHALLGGLLAGEPGLSGVGLALLRARGRTKHGQPHPLEFDRDIVDLERDTLAMADRLAERVSFVDVWGDVVEHGLTGTRCQRGPADPGESHRVGEHLGFSAAEQCVRR